MVTTTQPDNSAQAGPPDPAVEFVQIYDRCRRVFESGASWETKYDEIFRIARRARELYHLEWCDPDTTYCEDVTAFMTAFAEKAEDLRKTL